MNTLIYGANGQLGRDLLRVFASRGDCVGVDLPEVDVGDPEAVGKTAIDAAPDVIINAAAYTDVDGAESDAETCWRVNVDGARHVAVAAESVGAAIVYVSTDYVFDGSKTTPYLPEDRPNPTGVYAESKAAGEDAVMEAATRWFIVRTAWLYGPGGNNFVEKMLALARNHPKLRVVEDETGSPTHTKDLAEAIAALVQTDAYGIYHGVNRGQCSRFAFVQAIFEMAGLDVSVQPCSAAEFPSAAPRPAYSVLDPAALERVTGEAMREWRDALRRYMQRREELA